MKHTLIIITAAVVFVPLVMAIVCLPSARAQGGSPKAESAFACNRLALSPEQRKRHFDELGPQLLSLRRSFRELPNGYEFEFPADSNSVQLVAEWAIGERACCPFFDIDIRLEREGGSLWLGLTGREGTKQFIRADGAAWLRK